MLAAGETHTSTRDSAQHWQRARHETGRGNVTILLTKDECATHLCRSRVSVFVLLHSHSVAAGVSCRAVAAGVCTHLIITPGSRLA